MGSERYDISMFGNGVVEMGGGEYVRFDQAEAIIAAELDNHDATRELLTAAVDDYNKALADNALKDAEISRLRKEQSAIAKALAYEPPYQASLAERAEQLIFRNEALEENNRALTARVKELEEPITDAEINEALKGLLNKVVKTNHPVAHRVIRKLHSRNKHLETQFAALTARVKDAETGRERVRKIFRRSVQKRFEAERNSKVLTVEVAAVREALISEQSRRLSLETQLAAARKALTEIYSKPSHKAHAIALTALEAKP